MCGRFGLGASATMLIGQFNVRESVAWTARYNLAPSQEALVLVQVAGSGRQLRRMRWGLIPAWAKDPGIGGRLINVRAETVATKPAFRRSLRKPPWFIRMRDGGVFAFAGLWDRWTDPEGREIDSCTIITTSPNAIIRRFHHRMPVILAPEQYDLWLDLLVQDAKRLLPLLVPYPGEGMSAYPVSLVVNNPANDSPACQLPV